MRKTNIFRLNKTRNKTIFADYRFLFCTDLLLKHKLVMFLFTVKCPSNSLQNLVPNTTAFQYAEMG